MRWVLPVHDNQGSTLSSVAIAPAGFRRDKGMLIRSSR